MRQGWLVVPEVVPRVLCESVINAIEVFLNIRSDDPATWYEHPPSGHGIVPLHHDQALWNVRQYPAIHEVFADLYNTKELWVSMDRVAFKPPVSGWESEVEVDAFHWDGDPTSEEFSLQGLVYLRDTPPELGAFSCLPDIYSRLDNWLLLNDPKSLRSSSVNFSKKVIGAPAGSLVIWHRRMPHSSSLNLGLVPRWVQYVTMDYSETAGMQRHQRTRDFIERRPPAWAIRQNIFGQQVPEPGPNVELTSLGRKLVGIDGW